MVKHQIFTGDPEPEGTVKPSEAPQVSETGSKDEVCRESINGPGNETPESYDASWVSSDESEAVETDSRSRSWSGDGFPRGQAEEITQSTRTAELAAIRSAEGEGRYGVGMIGSYQQLLGCLG